MTETTHDVGRLLAAAESADRLTDSATSIQGAAKGISVSGHEWGAVGIAFSVHYDEAAKDINEHLDLLVTSLRGIESGIEATARNYAGANEAILARISALEADRPETEPGTAGKD
ncbi:hypothetical protein DZF91_12235 [Actinomadura logoneensis]|uniref:ESX-1 secretion-associated protein n=1 Tax=Actinomadura logoneensis TaxID=2293572 RepID=A0A372JNR5_9ACTN|nr:hypothetical protein [Actinomadura logoneensis]RFU41394.1 hypothetical protein DZF91_12235 [Actinomadura logoneensis]